jgi:hypothetical protein
MPGRGSTKLETRKRLSSSSLKNDQKQISTQVGYFKEIRMSALNRGFILVIPLEFANFSIIDELLSIIINRSA